MSCPTCGGPVEETWPEAGHPYASGPEASACGRCGRPLHDERHRSVMRSTTLSVEALAAAIHAVERGDEPGGGGPGPGNADLAKAAAILGELQARASLA